MKQRFYWTMTLALIAAFFVSNFAPIGRAMNEKESNEKKARAVRTTEQRLEKVALRFGGENPILPVVMHAMERYVKGTPAESDIDRDIALPVQRS